MIDIKLVRERFSEVKKNLARRQDNSVELLEQLKTRDEQWRKLKGDADYLRAERNKTSEEINKAKKKGKNIEVLVAKAKEIPEKLKKIEQQERQLHEEIRTILKKIPNLMSIKVPSGKSEKDNKVIKKRGKIPKFKFQVKTHVELAEKLGIVDFESSAKVSGNGFYYLKGDLAFLNQALIRFAVDFMKKKGYEYIEPPLLLRKDILDAATDTKVFEDSIYTTQDGLNLIGTSEYSVLGMHTGKTFEENELPKKYFAYSMCFRREVGSHGINEKGLWRTHQFNKVEQFVFCKPEESEKFYNELLRNSEEIVRKLKIPYRVIEMCAGDLSSWKHRAADIEAYRPTTKKYGEIMSLSNCTDYQARDLNIKVIRKNGEKQVVHTLNNTSLATSRALVVILENYQQKDGSIKIPSVLVKYMNGQKNIALIKVKVRKKKRR